MVDSWERARQVLDAAGVPPQHLVEELLLTDGRRYVLKVPPAPTVPGLLVSGAEFYRGAAAKADVPAPRVVSGGGRLLMTACPASPERNACTG